MRDLLIKDLGWKLFSLLLAAIIWLTVHGILLESELAVTHAPGSTVTYENLPVLVVAAASDVRYYRVAPATVSVTVSGPPEVMAILPANQIRAVVDLTDIEAAKDLKRRVDVYVPPGIALVRVEPAKVGVIVPPRPH